MPFDILIHLFPDLLPLPSHRGPTLVLWVVLERNGFPFAVSHITEVVRHSLTALLFLSGKDRCHLIVQIHAVSPWLGGGWYW